MKRSLRRHITIAVLAVSGLSGCLEETPEELVSPLPNIPAPTNLQAVIGAQEVTLTWETEPGISYSKFVVYRSDGLGSSRRIGATSTPATQYVDASVGAHNVYSYAVSGVNPDGVEGPKSSPLSVLTYAYFVRIDSDRAATNSRDVVLTFNASGAALVRFGEAADLSSAPWLPFAVNHPFLLSAGDGQKTVYAQFADQFGSTTEVVSDDILLDTSARISTASYSPSGNPVAPGTILHFTVTPVGNEKDGIVQIAVDGHGSFITARDDGSNGDTTAGNGVYEANFTVPPTLRGTDLGVRASFTDAVDNVSETFYFTTHLSITDPPAAVFCFPAEDSTVSSIRLRWTKSDDSFFTRYEIYRDLTSSVSNTQSPRVTSATSPNVTSYTDSGLEEGRAYFYVVYVINDLDETAASNVRLARTEDVPPTPVVCDPPSAVGPSRLTLTWSRNDNTDFLQYRVYRSLNSPGVTESSTLVRTISDRYETFIDDTGLADTGSNVYYYRVYVYDRAGNKARSNEVSSSGS